MRRFFEANDSLVSFTFDAGTSRASDPYLAIVAHWIDSEFKMHERLIGFPLIEGNHSGANIASILIDTFKAFDLFSPYKVRVITSNT